MPIDELERVAVRIYGAEWQSPLARDTGIALRTVQRWAARDAQPPDLRRRLAARRRARAGDLAALAEELERAAG